MNEEWRSKGWWSGVRRKWKKWVVVGGVRDGKNERKKKAVRKIRRQRKCKREVERYGSRVVREGDGEMHLKIEIARGGKRWRPERTAAEPSDGGKIERGGGKKRGAGCVEG